MLENPDLIRNTFWWLAKRHNLFEGRKRRKVARLKERSRALNGELVRRYDGILYQLFDCAGSAASFGERFPLVWESFIGLPSLRREYRLFSTLMWKVLGDYGAAIEKLKPKFMLRPFVDQMPAGEPRAALRTLVYERRGIVDPAGVSDQTATLLTETAYLVLHNQIRLQAHAGDIETLTGGVLSREVARRRITPVTQYHTWLFQMC